MHSINPLSYIEREKNPNKEETLFKDRQRSPNNIEIDYQIDLYS